MTDNEWKKLTHYLPVPIKARGEVEAELDTYHRVALATDQPPAVKGKLQTILEERTK